MNLIFTLLLLPIFIYAVVLFIFYLGLWKPNKNRSQDQPKVSVIIAARNEEKNLPNSLADLQKQTYPSDRIEFLIADDHSEDRTADIIYAISKTDTRFQRIPITTSEPGFTAKKNALTQALRHATGEIILSTDADCRALPTWVETMISFFTPDVGMVVGYSQFDLDSKHSTLIQKIQVVDFLMLMAAAQGTANLDRAWAASGQNLAYRKTAYAQVGGFSKIGHRISGDDVLFLQLIRKMTDWKVRFADSRDAYNHTQAEPTFSAFFNQRKRWASNAAYQWKLNKPFFGYVVTTFLSNLILFISLPLGLIRHDLILCLLVAWILKLLAEVSLFIRGCRIFRRRDIYSIFPFWFLFQIPYVIFVGLFGTLGGFTWKDRNHPSAEKK